MAPTLTLAELARAVNQSDDAQELLQRRIRHWSMTDVLPTEGDTHTGTGRMRRYRPETTYMAAILNALADFGLSVGALKAVSKLLSQTIKDKPEATWLWERAVYGDGDAWLWVYPQEDEGKGHVKLALLNRDGVCKAVLDKGGIVVSLRAVLYRVNV